MAVGEQTLQRERSGTDHVTTRHEVRQHDSTELRKRLYRHILIALLVAACVKQVVLVLVYPPFQGHDEVAHLTHLNIVATEGRLPTFSDRLPEDLEPYARYTLDWPALYTANHPPLYYLLSTPVLRLAGPEPLAQLYAVRLVSSVLFLLTVLLAARLAQLLLPGDAFLALTVPAVVAFQPQLGFEGAIVNNDMLAICLGTALLVLLLTALRQGLSGRLAVACGTTLGLGLLAKATLTALVPVVALVVLWCLRAPAGADGGDRAGWALRLGRLLAVALPAVLLPLPWYYFLHRTYGDFTAFRALDTIQATWNVPEGSFTDLLLSGSFHLERIHETWGWWGWKLLPLWSGELKLVYALMIFTFVGLVSGALRVGPRLMRTIVGHNEEGAEETATAACLLTLIAASLAMYLAMTYIGTANMLTQARYVFPILPGAIAVAMLGVREMVPATQRPATIPIIVIVFAAIWFALLTRTVLPYAAL